MARLMALSPLRRLARRLLLPHGLMRAPPQPARRPTRRRPRSIAAAARNGVVRRERHAGARNVVVRRERHAGARNVVVRRQRHPPRPAQQLPPSSVTHREQQHPQQQLTVSSESGYLESGYLVAIQYVNLVKASLNSTEKFRRFLGILNEYREKLAREGEGADVCDTFSQVDEVLQGHPALIVAFRQFFP